MLLHVKGISLDSHERLTLRRILAQYIEQNNVAATASSDVVLKERIEFAKTYVLCLGDTVDIRKPLDREGL